MNWIENLNRALDHIESNLDKELDHEEIAKAAFTSRFHFQRLFYMVSGQKLGEYIRLRRLSVAVCDLMAPGAKVIDVALKYGYETPESFSKAFKKLHGVSPSAVRKSQTSLQAIPPLRFQLTVKGEFRMNYKIVEKEAFKLTGFKIKVSTKDNQNFVTLPKFWEDLHAAKKVDALYSQAPDGDVFGACVNFEKGDEEFDYLAAIRGEKFDGYEGEVDTVTVPASTWAVFTDAGVLPEAIQKTWKQIYHEWFPATNYEHAGTAELEIYPSDCETPEGMRFEIWIPVVESSKE